MARATDVVSPAQTAQGTDLDLSELAGSASLVTASANAAPETAAMEQRDKQDNALPLPGWIKAFFYVFPVVLYVPDTIFNYIVYSDGVQIPDNALIHAGQVVLWGFLSVGVVGMAYLLSILAPFHWSQGHRLQAFFCGVGVLIATGITTWNSLAYRSLDFHDFKTDSLIYNIWPQLQANHISFTMILVAVAPPFWGLFWAIVQPIERSRNLNQMRESHQERLLRLQQEAEVKALRAQANAKIREAQLRGMAATASAAREQAKGFINQNRDKGQLDPDASSATNAAAAPERKSASSAAAESATRSSSTPSEAPRVLQLPPFAPSDTRGDSAFYNQATPVTTTSGITSPLGQPALMASPDVSGSLSMPASDAATMGLRRPPVIGADALLGDNDEMTGTTGPRPAVRRAPQLSSLTQNVGGPSQHYIRAVDEAMRALNIPTTKRNGFPRELAALVAEKLNIDEPTARTVISRVLRARDPQRSPR